MIALQTCSHPARQAEVVAPTREAKVCPFVAKVGSATSKKPGWAKPLPVYWRGTDPEVAFAVWWSGLPEEKRARLSERIPSDKYGQRPTPLYQLPAPPVEIASEDGLRVVVLDAAPSYGRQRRANVPLAVLVENCTVRPVEWRRNTGGRKRAPLRPGLAMGRTSSGLPAVLMDWRFTARVFHPMRNDWRGAVLGVCAAAKAAIIDYREGRLQVDPSAPDARGIPKRGAGSSRAHPKHLLADIVPMLRLCDEPAPTWALEPAFLAWVVSVVSYASSGGRDGQIALGTLRDLLADPIALGKRIREHGDALAARLWQKLPGVEADEAAGRARALFDDLARRIDGKARREAWRKRAEARADAIEAEFFEASKKGVDFHESASFLRSRAPEIDQEGSDSGSIRDTYIYEGAAL